MGFLFFPVMPMGLRWAALRAAGAPLLHFQETHILTNYLISVCSINHFFLEIIYSWFILIIVFFYQL